MHDLRPFDLRDGSRPEPTQREREEDRRYDYVPTFILRGLIELHFEFAP